MIYINTTGKVNQVWLPKPYDIVISDCPEAIDAWNSGYTSGYTDGFDDGLESGYTSGYTDGYEDGINSCSGGSCEGIWESGYTSGYTDGAESVDCSEFYVSGKTDGWNAGYQSGYTDGAASVDCTEFYESGFTAGYESGLTDGMEDLKANIQGDYFIIPEGTKNIRRNAFQFTCFSSITIPDSVEYIGDEAFSSNNCLEHLTIPNSVSGIGTAICSYCENLIDVTFEDSLDEIPGYTFTQNYNLTGITFPRNVKYIGMSAFGSCSCLTDMVIPNSVSGIGDSSFRNCISLTSITLPNELRVLEGSCFRNDGALQNITIPAKVSEIGYRAFQNCSGLTEMTFKGLTPPTLAATSGNNASLGSTTYTFPFYVPCESLEAYKTAFGSDYEPRIFCNSGQTMPTALTLNVDSAITDNGEATVTIEPNGSEGDIIFSSSDDTVATIDQNGNITVLSSGTVTICAYDSRRGLEDCKTVAVIK